MPERVELITYADRLGGTLRGLKEVLDGPLSGLFGGVHILPFFRPFDGADAGFDPADHTAVDERLGTWADVSAIAENYTVMADVIVNHVSKDADSFRDWLSKGSESAYDGMFLTFGGAFPDGATEDVLMKLYRPRPGLPFTPYPMADGTKRLVWTTFTPAQIDIDVRNPVAHDYLIRVLDAFAAGGVTQARLDAVGYAVKTPGLSSFMTPETFAFIDEVTAWCQERGLEVLVEVHSYYERQVEIAKQVDRVYDFALPPLILHALTAGDASPLIEWASIRPVNAVTVLDTHDGIGVIDVGGDGHDPSKPGLLTDEQIDALVEAMHANSGGTSRLATGAAASNVDLYQVNSTYYDALGKADDKYLLARAIQFWMPGIPQVYYVGLLAGSNDVDLLSRSHVGRDVNRHYYTREEIEAEVQRPVVQSLFRLIRFCNTHPAFDGDFVVTRDGSTITATWTQGADRAILTADVAAAAGARVTWTAEGEEHQAPLAELPY